MKRNDLQPELSMVRNRNRTKNEKTASEVGTVWKRWEGNIRVALAYPNSYHVGMSNLGFHAVYQRLNDIDGVLCERVFTPDETDRSETGVVSLESQRPLADFDVLAFSVSFENDYPNILTILESAGLPLRSMERSKSDPLVIAGGVACMLNPEPIAAFVDCFLIGEAEPLLHPFFREFDPETDRWAWLKQAARRLDGLYVPRFYKPSYRTDGTLSSFRPVEDVPEKIQKVIQPDLTPSPACSGILTYDTTFSQTYLIESGRGCPHGCRFCAAGFIFRPPRFLPAFQIENRIRSGAALTSKIGLVGAAVSDHPEIGTICEAISGSGIRLGFSSLRADGIGPELLSALKASGIKTATIAPDSGSERMRRVINKGITETQILDAAQQLVENGIPNLRLYFMVGLPTETPEDIDAIPSLCKRIKHRFLKSSRGQKRIGEITVSLSSFVPKPSTPFQWAAMDETEALKGKVKRIKTGLKGVANVRVNADIPRWAFIQGIFSRGDRKASRLLMLAHRNKGNWPQTLKASPINPDFYVFRERTFDELLPWDFIDHGITKKFLIREYRRALAAEPSDVCRVGSCRVCGVCDKSRS